MTTPAPKTELARLEAVVHRNLKASREAWFALVEIHDRELWREAQPPKGEQVYGSWADYLHRRYKGAYTLAAAGRKVKVARAQLTLLGSESLSDRALNVIADESPEVQAAALELAKATAGSEAPTEEEMRAALETVQEETPEEDVAATQREENAAKRGIQRDTERAAKRRLTNLCERIRKGLQPENYDAANPLIAALIVLIDDDDPERVARITEAAKEFEKETGPRVERGKGKKAA